jgi:hypothetical protein
MHSHSGALEAAMFESHIAEDDVSQLYGKKEEPEPEPVKQEKTDIDQICNQIKQHKTPFNPSTFIEHHVKKYTTDTIAQVLQKVLDKMDMAAGVDKILLVQFDFWKYGSEVINQMKIRGHDKLEEQCIRKELSQQKRTPEHKSSWKAPIYGF